MHTFVYLLIAGSPSLLMSTAFFIGNYTHPTIINKSERMAIEGRTPRQETGIETYPPKTKIKLTPLLAVYDREATSRSIYTLWATFRPPPPGSKIFSLLLRRKSVVIADTLEKTFNVKIQGQERMHLWYIRRAPSPACPFLATKKTNEHPQDYQTRT